MTLQLELCVVPIGYEELNVTSCTVYFSVCKALPGARCAGVTNSSTCQEVVTNDGQMHYYSIGDYRGNDGYEATGDTSPPLTLSSKNLACTSNDFQACQILLTPPIFVLC